ncbi:MAG TPA: hypothetical protein PKD60_14185 [Turneriella sp.]|nr:hypothetical protein [Turneriella sp.]
MKDNWRAIFCLAQLERNQDGMTMDRLHSQLVEADLKPPVIRTLQRDIEALGKRKLNLTKRGHKYRFEPTETNMRAFFQVLREYSLSKQGGAFFYGSIDVQRVVDYFAARSGVIDLVYTLLHAIQEKRIVTFDYTPQSDLTKMKMIARANYQPTNPRVIPVRMLPHQLVTAGNSFLVLGEFYERQGLFRGQFKKPVVRHYELRGITKFALAEKETPKLDINPAEIYRNSVHVWAGGHEYDVELEELWYDGGKPQRRKRKVNGEDEVLSLSAGSLGRIKIVNPPEELRNRAKQIGLPEELVFRFDD